ncbi:MAG: 5-(carboxyamino)imidazole ribonucleotide synthase [Cyanobacteria bacterium P01_A01_bin.123]
MSAPRNSGHIPKDDASAPAIARVGIIGGGQLAWMMAPGAKKLNLQLVVQTPKVDDPAVAIASETVLAPVADAAATAKLASHCDVITFENEFIDLPALKALAAQNVRFYPQLSALEPLLDKAEQRAYCQNLGLPTPKFVSLILEPGKKPDSKTIKTAISHLGTPVVLKTCRHGYDGQGTFILHSPAEVESTWQKLGYQPVLLEAFVPFDRELAIMVARSQTGDVVTYPVVETQQIDQICRRVIAPAPITDAVKTAVESMARSLMESLKVVGIFGIELFLTADGQVLINEIAPRTHNSGHYSLDACKTSQFEQQLRTVSGQPLGSPTMTCRAAVMVNLLGYETSTDEYLDKRRQLEQLPNSHVYWYGKTEARPGRKLGHVTVLLHGDAEKESEAVQDAIARIESIWYPQVA